MQWKYENFNLADLQGTTLADYLVNVEADFEIVDGDDLIYDELAFPVAELAREISEWLSRAEGADFNFESLSFEDPGAVRILSAPDGWIVGSALTPEKMSAPQSWRELSASINEFIWCVRRDLQRSGVDAEFVLGSHF